MTSRRTLIKYATGATVMLTLRSTSRAQNGHPDRTSPGQPVAKSGVIVAVQGRTIYAQNSAGPLTISVANVASIWKKAVSADISVLKVGDDILVRGTLDPSGNFVAREIWANLVSYFGTITTLSGASIQILQPNGDKKIVRFDEVTQNGYGVLAGADLKIGRTVQVIGMMSVDGTIEATRINVYENGRPLGSDSSKIMDPYTGKIL
jgi:hypothetical protein